MNHSEIIRFLWGMADLILSAYGPSAQHCRPTRHRLPAPEYCQAMAHGFHIWREMTGMTVAA
jgi:hypothetical protein